MLAALSKDQKEAGRCRQNTSANKCHTPGVRGPGAEQAPPAARHFGLLSAQDEALHVAFSQFRSAAQLSRSI